MIPGMISLKINNVPVLFIRGFTSQDVRSIIEFVREADSERAAGDSTVLFIDTPETVRTVEAVRMLTAEGYRVVFRDHHEVEGEPATESDRQKITSTEALRKLLGNDCTITSRTSHPACSTLVAVGEFKGATAIIADPDADGLTAAMKAAGVYYDGLDDDAVKLDGEPSLQVTGTTISQFLAKGMASLPSYDPARPGEREGLQGQLFADWVAAVQGDGKALLSLQKVVAVYDSAVAAAVALAREAKRITPHVVLADTTGSPLFDVGTLTSLMEQMPDCRVTAIRRDKGPIAALHGVQYSLAVAKPFQREIDLKRLLPETVNSDPREGIITNVSFLLHVSQERWDDCVLPALKKL
jgi:hypothetical protein